MKNVKSNRMVLLSILGAWAVVLRMIDFPILPFAPFLKMDLSDLMVLVGLLIGGPKGLIAVAGIRDGVNYLMSGGEGGIPIGIIMSFIASMAMFLPTHYILKFQNNKQKILTQVSLSISLVISLTVIMALLNYYIALPIYVKVMDFPIDNYLSYLISFIIPFNLLKGIIVAIGQLIILNKIPTYIEKKIGLYPQYRPNEELHLSTFNKY